MTEPEPMDSSVTPLARLLGLAARIGTQIFTRVRFKGSLDAIPAEGPVILAANHVSNVDGVVLGGWLIPRLPRRVHWLGKREMFDVPIMGWVVRGYGVHPVERSGADIEAFRIAEGILDAGQILLLFPEGTRSGDGTLQQPRDAWLRRSRKRPPVRIALENLGDDVRDGVARECRAARQHLVEHTAEGPEIGALVDRLAPRLLGAHVGRRPENHPVTRAADREGG